MYVKLFQSRGSLKITERYDGPLITGGPAMDLKGFLLTIVKLILNDKGRWPTTAWVARLNNRPEDWNSSISAELLSQVQVDD